MMTPIISISRTSNLIEEIAKLGTYETDLTTGTWTGSPNFIKIFGLQVKPFYTVEEFQAIVHPDDFQEVMTHFGECLAAQKDFNYEYRCLKADGTSIYVQSTSKVYYATDGTPLRIVGIKQDITERKLTEIRLKELTEAMETAQSTHFSAIIHDLKNPLHQIKGLTHLLKVDGLDKSEVIDFLETIFTYSSDLIQNLLETFEIESDGFHLNCEPINLVEVMNTIVQTNRVAAIEKQITIETLYHNETCTILADKIKITRAINNLLSNALKFSNPNSKIVITTRLIKDAVELTIKDAGIGINPTAQKFIFDRFSKYRRKGTQGEKTTGMGLFITKRIVEAHQGKISFKSKEGIGTTFTVKLKTVV